jgi:chemotaxis signal transduction protein
MTERLIMRVGADRFAMSVEHVVRVSPAQDAEPLPLVPAHVEGLAVYGSDVVPQISLAASVGMEPPDQAGGFVTLADTASGLMGLRHDGFEGVHTFPDGRLAPVAAPPGDCRTGMIRLAGKRVFAVDAQRIRIPTVIGTSPMVPMEPIEEPRVAFESVEDEQNADRALGFRLHGREHAFSLDLIDRIEAAQDGQTRLVLRSDQGWAVLEVESVSGLSSSAENVKLSDALLGELTWSQVPAHGRTDAADDETGTLPVFRLEAGGIACVIARRDIILVSAMAYVPAPWMTERFDGLAATAQGILPVVDLSRRLGQGAKRGGVCVAIQSHGEVWALACDRVVDAGQAQRSSVDDAPPWSSGVVELRSGTCPLLDLDHVMSWGRAA